MRFRASEAIESNRQRLGDAIDQTEGSTQNTSGATDAHTNIKVELQQDPTVQPKPNQVHSLRGIIDAIRFLGDKSELDIETGEIVYESQDPDRYQQLASQVNPLFR